MKLSLGSDHAGVEAKAHLKAWLESRGHEVQDRGPAGTESVDYPDYALEVARDVSGGRAERGVLVCGTGIGMSMTANRVRGVRAALCHNRFTAEMARRHNNANVLCLGARVLDEPAMLDILDVWMATPFEGGRHARRVEKIDGG